MDRFFLSLLLVIPLAMVSCEKVRDAVGKLDGEIGGKDSTAKTRSPVVTELDGGSYQSFPQQPGKVVIIDFYADWCGPCRQLSPLLEAIARESPPGLVVIGKVNVDKNRKIASDEGVKGIPDVRIYRGGSLVDQFVGIPPLDDLQRRIAEQAKGLTAPEVRGAGSSSGSAAVPIEPHCEQGLPPGMRRR